MKNKFSRTELSNYNNYNVIIHVLPFENITQIIHRKMALQHAPSVRINILAKRIRI